MIVVMDWVTGAAFLARGLLGPCRGDAMVLSPALSSLNIVFIFKSESEGHTSWVLSDGSGMHLGQAEAGRATPSPSFRRFR